MQFGNNWIENFPDCQMGRPWNFFYQFFPNWTTCSPIAYKLSGGTSSCLKSFYGRKYSLILTEEHMCLSFFFAIFFNFIYKCKRFQYMVTVNSVTKVIYSAA